MTGMLRILPLGGIGEIGKNMTVFEYGDEIVVIDCGLMFPEEEMFGVDFVVPDITYLQGPPPHGQGVPDHARARGPRRRPAVHPARVPGRADLRHRPWHAACWATRSRSTSSPTTRCWRFDPGETVEIGAFSATAFRIGHSIPDAMGIALRTPLGLIVHTGDFKFDHTPVDGKMSDIHALAAVRPAGRPVPHVRLDARRDRRATRRPSGSSARSSATSWRASTAA